MVLYSFIACSFVLMAQRLRYFVVAIHGHYGFLPGLPRPQLRDARLQLCDTALEAPDDVPFRVRKSQHRIVTGVGERHDVARNADDRRVWRNVRDDDRACPDLRVLADRHVTDYLRARADHNVGVQGRVPLGPPGARPAQGHPLEEVDVVLDDRGLTDYDPHPMVDEEPFSDACPRVDLDPGECPAQVRHEPRRHAQPAPVQRMRKAVDLAGVKAGIGEYYFEVAGRGGIALPRRL